LQKKGWLGVNQNEKWGTGNKRFVQDLFDIAEVEKVNFFKDKLQYLFYEALAKERDNENSFYEKLNCRIPFLNGGLFEADYDWLNANITIPTALFRSGEEKESERTGILDVFGRYNFTIKEDEPLDKEVAVDPEMLGKVFENMLEVTERKSKGAFYTPREIVHYMCQESLIHYLDNTLNDTTQSYQPIDSDQVALFGGSTNKKGQAIIELEHNNNILVPKTDIEDYIREGHFALENDQRVASKGETRTYQYQLPESIRQNAELIDKKLSDIRICDPAIGSGAFPVGLLHELVNAQLVLKPHFGLNYLKEKLDRFGFKERESVNESRYIYRLKRHIIQESIYGVDIDASAIDIARLRLWLSLVVDEDDLDPIETLPNLDYKIVCGNSLVGMPETAMRSLEVEKDLENLKEQFYNQTNETKKKALRQEINTKIRELLDSAETFAGYKIDFDFRLFFSEVWREKGGFDVVIGNPPYGASLNKQEKDLFRKQYIDLEFKIDSYEVFTLMSNKLMRQNGVTSFIIPSNLMDNFYSKKIRKNLLNKHILEIIELDDKVFMGAVVHSMILTWSNQQTSNYLINCKIGTIGSEKLFYSSDSFFLGEENQTFSLRKVEFKKILDTIYFDAKRLEDVLKIKDGIDTGDNVKYVSDIEISGWKKLIGGSDVNRWKINKWRYVNYGKHLANPRDPDLFENDKIVIRETGDKIIATLDKEGFFALSTLYSGYIIDSKFSLKSILGLLHSEIIHFLMVLTAFGRTKGAFTKTRIFHYYSLPVKNDILKYSATIDVVVDYQLFINSVEDNNVYNSFYNSLLDGIFYSIFFPKQFKDSGKQILQHLENLKPINDSMSEEEKLAIIQAEFERLYDDRHPVKFAIETLDSIEEVRIIKEALK
jgi:hypothetical protein